MFTTSNRSMATAPGAKVASVIAVAGHDDEAVLAVASVAADLATALASAILEAARARDVCVETVTDADDTTPVGVAARVDGRSVLVGNVTLLNQLCVSLDGLGDGPERLRRRGEHVLFVSIDGEIAGCFGLVRARN